MCVRQWSDPGSTEIRLIRNEILECNIAVCIAAGSLGRLAHKTRSERLTVVWAGFIEHIVVTCRVGRVLKWVCIHVWIARSFVQGIVD